MSRKQLTETARQVESLGYSTLLVPDHFTEQLAPIPALMLAAEATTRLRVGSFVFGNDYHHPAMLAKETATLDLLTDGRLEVGIGAGWFQGEYQQAGLPFDPPATRIDRMQESVQILKGLWREGPFTFSGRHYQIQALEGHPKPLQRPHPPIMIGGGGQRLLTIAGREANIVGLAPRVPAPDRLNPRTEGRHPGGLTAAATSEKVQWVREAAGARFAEIEINTYPSLGQPRITDDRRGVAQEMTERLRRRYPNWDLTEDEFLDSPHIFLGTVDQLVEKILGLRQRFGISYVVMISAEMIEPFAPVVARLAGK
jgi:probable F420-dependent oxidoreductase